MPFPAFSAPALHLRLAMSEIPADIANQLIEIEARQDQALRELAELDARIDQVLTECSNLCRRLDPPTVRLPLSTTPMSVAPIQMA
jgi:hypothetical protein